MPSDPKRCESSRKDGGPCLAPALPDSQFCWAHDPQRAEQRAEARRRGGQHSAKIHRLRGLTPPRLLPIFDQLETALTEVHDGSLDPRAASAMASLARAMTTLLTAGEIEQRLRDLETATTDDEGGSRQWR